MEEDFKTKNLKPKDVSTYHFPVRHWVAGIGGYTSEPAGRRKAQRMQVVATLAKCDPRKIMQDDSRPNVFHVLHTDKGRNVLDQNQ